MDDWLESFSSLMRPNSIRRATIGFYENDFCAVSTVAVYDRIPEYETAYRSFSQPSWNVVARYQTPEEAADGHARWVRHFLSEYKP